MDKRIIITITATVLLSLFFLFYKLFQKECSPIEIAFEPLKPVQGEVIKFKSITESDEIITWSFDGGNSFETGAERTHKYDAAGTYKVKAQISENCFFEKEIVVASKRKMELVKPSVSYPSEIHVDEEVTFNDLTNEASVWNWKVLETGETGNEKVFTSTFKNTGKYKINLCLKGSYVRGDTTFVIDVIKAVAPIKLKPIVIPQVTKTNPKPVQKAEPKPEPKPEPIASPPAAPAFLSDAEFKSKFIMLANAIGGDDDNASNEWRDIIVAQTGTAGSMKIVISDGEQQLATTLENFKQKQLISTYKVENVTDIVRLAKKGASPIVRITVVVTKKQ